ncbi:MAG: glycosyltransferase family A protein [Methanoregula sp.]
MLITIGTPHSGFLVPEYVMSLCQTLMDTGGIGFEVLHYEGCYVHSLRNLLMQNAKGDYLLFIDSDMKWSSSNIASLVKAEKPIIGGLYYKRRFPYGPVVYKYDAVKGTFDSVKAVPERLFQCDGIGTGFLLIHRGVIDKFKEPELCADWGMPFDPIKVEAPGTAGSYFMGEDLSFCAKAKTLGIEIWCDPETVVKHVGRGEVGGPLYAV